MKVQIAVQVGKNFKVSVSVVLSATLAQAILTLLV